MPLFEQKLCYNSAKTANLTDQWRVQKLRNFVLFYFISTSRYKEAAFFIDFCCFLTIKFPKMLNFYREKKLVTTFISKKLRYNST